MAPIDENEENEENEAAAVAFEEPPVDESVETPQQENDSTPSATASVSSARRLHSAATSGMDSSVLRFKNVNFTIGKGDKEKQILQDVSGTVKFGRE